jgi:nitroreductase
MDLMDVIKTRRSIRKYKSDPVPENVLNQILEAARFAPSSGNRQPWHFIVVKDPDIKKELGISSWASNAPVVIIGCANATTIPTFYAVDLAIAFEHIVLAAANFGLGTCWIGRLDADETIKSILGIPEYMKVVAVTPLGYPAETPNLKERKPLSEIIHYEKY